MKKPILIAHGVWIVFALAVALEAGRLGFGSFIGPGPGFVPLLTGLCLGLLAVMGLAQAVAGKEAPGNDPVFHGSDMLRIALVIGVLFAYVLLWDKIGFLLATFFVLLFLFRSVEPLRWRTVVIASSLTLGFTYFLFSVLLGARLPSGRLWIYFTN